MMTITNKQEIAAQIFHPPQAHSSPPLINKCDSPRNWISFVPSTALIHLCILILSTFMIFAIGVFCIAHDVLKLRP